MRYVLKVAYDGTDFKGWQIQPNGRTVQQAIKCAVFEAFGEEVPVVGSGRTDSGVHAAAQVCHIDLQKELPGERVADALNLYLSEDVSVLCSAVAPAGFDANASAKKKTYSYHLYFSPRRNPLKDRFSVRIKRPFDIDKAQKAVKMFVGEHDFAAYCAAGSKVKTTVRKIYSFTAEQNGCDYVFTVCGNGFLYNMVRTLVGTVIGYAEGKVSEENIAASLNRCDRAKVGKTMPPHGLILEDVDYGVKLFD